MNYLNQELSFFCHLAKKLDKLLLVNQLMKKSSISISDLLCNPEMNKLMLN